MSYKIMTQIYVYNLGGNIPKPLRYWKESVIPENILKLIEDAGYDKAYVNNILARN